VEENLMREMEYMRGRLFFLLLFIVQTSVSMKYPSQNQAVIDQETAANQAVVV